MIDHPFQERRQWAVVITSGVIVCAGRFDHPSRVATEKDKQVSLTNLADAMPLAKLLGVDVLEAGPQRIVGALAVRDDLCTTGGTVHGGTLMAFADSLAAIGAFISLPQGAGGTTTIESKTNFVGRAASGDKLTGRSTPVSTGRRVSVWQTQVCNQHDRLVALVTQTQLIL